MLDQNSKKALDGAENSSMEHDRSLVGSLVSYKFQFKFLRQRHVKLYSSTLPMATDRIADMNVNFRTVKSAVPFIDPVRMPPIIKSSFQAIRGNFPIFV